MSEAEVDAVCLCRTAACRGLVGGWRRLPSRLRRAYRGWTAEYLLEENGPEPRASVPAADLERGYRYGVRTDSEASASPATSTESPSTAE